MSAQIEQALHGAHDADRTRDLVLTKDVLYQLSYVGTPLRQTRIGKCETTDWQTIPVLRPRRFTLYGTRLLIGAGDGI